MNRAEAASTGAFRQRFRLRLKPLRREFRILLVAAAIALLILAIWAMSVAWGAGAPGSAVGTGFGIAAAVSLLIVMAYSVRRAMPAVRVLGRTRTYLQAHVLGGLLFLLLMLVHTSFRMPSGTLVTVLWLLSLWVVGSGLLGLWLQKAVPRILGATSTFEVQLERIPDLVGELRGRAEALSARLGPPVTDYYHRELAPDMQGARATIGSLLGRSRITSYRAQEFQILRRTLAEDVAPGLDEIFKLHATKLEMDVHYTLQRVLRLWLAFHLPASIVLLGFVLMHILFVLYY